MSEITPDFLAMGTARWMLRDLTIGMGHSDGIDRESLWRELAAGAHAWQLGDAQAAASRLRAGFELLTQSRLRTLTDQEFGADTKIPDKAFPSLITSILARLATEAHVVYCAIGGELQARHFGGMLRVHVVAPENVRVGNLIDRNYSQAFGFKAPTINVLAGVKLDFE